MPTRNDSLIARLRANATDARTVGYCRAAMLRDYGRGYLDFDVTFRAGGELRTRRIGESLADTQAKRESNNFHKFAGNRLT